MPGLVFRRRRLLLGGDELMVPFSTSACGRALWVLFLVVGLSIASHLLLWGRCHNIGYIVFTYEFLSVLVGLLSLIVECQIAMASTYGTIIEPGPRNDLLEKYLSRKATLGVVQLLLGLCGTALILYIPMAFACRGTDSMALVMSGLVLTTISQFLDSMGMYCCFLAFTSADSIWIHEDEEGEIPRRHGLLSEMERKYEAFCRTACKWAALCSCTFNVFGGGEQEADFAHVARVFSRMLSARRYVDVVATDIAAGLILLRHVQKAEDYSRRDELKRGFAVTTDPGLARGVRGSITGSDGGDSSGGGAVNFDESSLPSSGSLSSVFQQGRKTPEEESLGQSGGTGRRSSGRRSSGAAREGRAGGGGMGREKSWRRERRKAGKVPLNERPQRHRKYYKVSREETMLDLTEGGEDCRVLQEVAHFISYANVMYSVWGTLIIDPRSGIRRIIRRSGSWCPKFVSRRGAVHRDSLFRANSSSSTGFSRNFDGGGGGDLGRKLGGSSAAVSEVDGALEDDRIRLSSSVPGLCEAEIRGDNWWGSHETALRSELPHGAELVLAHFNNCLDETPYCVAVDHTWQSIIITIRGTHSFEDFLVDSMAEPLSLESVGEKWGFDGSGMHAHEGILRRAEWIRGDLEKSGVLHLLLGTTPAGDEWSLTSPTRGGAETDGRGRVSDRRGVWTKSDSQRTRDGIRFSSLAPLASAVGGSGFCSEYTVRTVGHSLGGGVAALLALLLKPAYPTVRGLAVSPPGGLVSEGACREATEAMVTSVVLNDDVVPRMSSQSIEVLAHQVLEVLGRSRVSKFFVMRSLLLRDEEAHRPELYLEPEETGQESGRRKAGGGGREQVLQDPDDEEQQLSGERLVGWRRPSDVYVGGEGAEFDVDGGGGESGVPAGAQVSGEDVPGSGGESKELRYHRQLRRYREHLLQERGSRRHLHRLRLPGRILHLVNTDFVTEEVETTACEDGCFSCILNSCSHLLPSRVENENEVDPCCCTPGVSQRRRRVFTPVWSSPTDLSEIRVTPAFLVDHSPDEILKAVEQTIEDLGVST